MHDTEHFEAQLIHLLNITNREAISNTPDFILARCMIKALEAFENACKGRDAWYGIAPEPGWKVAIGPHNLVAETKKAAR